MKYPPEVELLLCCAHSQIAPPTAQHITKLIQSGLDWNYLLQIARRHKMLPLLYWHLHKICAGIVPYTILDELHQYFNNNIQRNQFLLQELLKLLDLFEGHKIPVIPYKGPTLAISTHKNLTLRHWWDLDFIVDEKDFVSIRKILLGKGYKSQCQQEWEESFIDETTKLKLDVHRCITPKYFPIEFDFQYFWNRARYWHFEDLDFFSGSSVSIGNPGQSKVPMLAADDLLILLSIQIAKDTWENRNRMIKICDLLELILSRQDWEWKQVLEKASNLNCKRLVCFSLLLTEDLIGEVIPHDIVKEIKLDPVVTWYNRNSQKKLFLNKNQRDKSKNTITIFLERLLVDPSPKKRVPKGYLLRHFIRLIFQKTLKFISN